MKFFTGSMIAAAVLFSGTAQAANLDFVAEAAGMERGINSGDSLVFDGLSVQFDANSTYHPYFDDLSGGLPAGLGVCKSITASLQCDPGDDDNLTDGEWVKLTFAKTVELSGFSFTDADHLDLNSSSLTLKVGLNGGALMETTFASVVSSVFTDVNMIQFAYGERSPTQYYINGVTATPVPLPAAAPLLVAGIGALGAMRRRRKAA